MLTFLVLILTTATTLLSQPLIIGHRGACGHVPEHTIESYLLAIEMGADYVEPDLVSTKDGVLVCRHENEIGGTTDVAEKFPKRKTKKQIDGQDYEGWFVEDFTLEEIKTLRAKERLGFRDQSKNGQYTIPTFEEMIALVKKESKERDRVIGIYPETKHPTYHQKIGLPLEEKLVAILHKNGWKNEQAPVFIQSFEPDNLKQLKSMTKIRLIQLMKAPDVQPGSAFYKGESLTYKDLMTEEALTEIKKYAYGIGPWKQVILPVNKNGYLMSPTPLLDLAHKQGLKVHIFTMRNESLFLAKDYQGDPMLEYKKWIEMGIDGFFTDFPDTAVQAREKYSKK